MATWGPGALALLGRLHPRGPQPGDLGRVWQLERGNDDEGEDEDVDE